MSKKGRPQGKGGSLRKAVEKISESLQGSEPVSRRAFLGRAGKVITLGAMAHFIMLGSPLTANAKDPACCTPAGSCDNCDPPNSCDAAAGGETPACSATSTPPNTPSCDPSAGTPEKDCQSFVTDGCQAHGACDAQTNEADGGCHSYVTDGCAAPGTCDAGPSNTPGCDPGNGATDPSQGDAPNGCGDPGLPE